MSSPTATSLAATWDGIPVGVTRGALRGRPVGRGGTLMAAVDHAGAWHFLVPAAASDGDIVTVPIRGLEVVVDTLSVEGGGSGRFYDVCCSADAFRGQFAAVAAEMAAALEDPQAEADRIIAQTLLRWKAFWDVPAGGLSVTEQTGLFGELYFLDQWLSPLVPRHLEAWTGPRRDRHDFKSASVSVEVKASRTSATTGASHRIASLEQLADPVTGSLFLFSVSITPDKIGGYSLAGMIERIRARLGPADELLFDELLGLAGYSPIHHERYSDPLRVIGERLYAVEGAFPRLTDASFVGGIPPGVVGVTYEIDLAAASAFLVESAPGPAAATISRELAT